MNAAKLAKLQSQVRIGGKGTPRRKVKKVQKVVIRYAVCVCGAGRAISSLDYLGISE